MEDRDDVDCKALGRAGYSTSPPLGPIGYMSGGCAYHEQVAAEDAGLKRLSLHITRGGSPTLEGLAPNTGFEGPTHDRLQGA